MKKIVLSAFVVGSFIMYSLSQRQKVAANTESLNPLSNGAQVTPIFSTPTPELVSQTPVVTPTPKVIQTPVSSGYKDGQYTGRAYDAYYGYVQVGAQIQGGKLVDVSFLRYPNDRGHSIMVSNYSLPILRQEAIQTQSANVNIVSGATDTSLAFRQSLSSALAQAK